MAHSGPVRTHLIKLACDVIQSSTRQHTTDRVLADFLRQDKELPPEDKREVSRAVFTYYRWLGWLKDEKSTRMRLYKAQKLAERFASSPLNLPPDHMRAKAVPRWLEKEMPITDEWLRALQREPRLWLRARPGQAKALAKKLKAAKVVGIGDAVVFEGERDLFATPEFLAGEFEIQDISSQAVGLVCDPQPGETWWDACAGEGGKTLHLADLMQSKGLVWATDRAEWRLQRLKRRTARAKIFNYRSEVWEGGPQTPKGMHCDGVLVDAPCTGIGTWDRNPHARWTLSPVDVTELAEAQTNLLNNVAGAVKPGGRLIYSVCTLTRRETTEVVAQFTKAHPEFTVLPLKDPFAPDLPPRESLMLWPHRTKGNGMFIAGWQRKKD